MSDKPNFPRMLKNDLAEVADELWTQLQDAKMKVEALNEERVQILNELADLQDATPEKPKLKLVENIELGPVLDLVDYLDEDLAQRRAARGLMQASAPERKIEELVEAARLCLNSIIEA